VVLFEASLSKVDMSTIERHRYRTAICAATGRVRCARDVSRDHEKGNAMLVAFSVTPLGGESDSVGKAVAEAVRVVRESGLPNETTAMFTTIEGEWDEVMAVIKKATEAITRQAPRASLVIKADVRPGYTNQLAEKVARLEHHLKEEA
jgi:uncharacterized protein (TIGR00106 family)